MPQPRTPPHAADFGRLIEPLLDQAAGYARSILRSRQDAEDAVQQAALRGLERFDTFDTGRSFKGWFFAILRNCCLDCLRCAKTFRTVVLEDHDRPSPQSVKPQEWEALAEAMARLTAEHRDILRLRYFGGLSYRELAEALGIPQGTVMSRLHFARKAIAEQMTVEDL